jgi:hypothetical protein
MGATRQTVNGRWFNDMLTFWPFVLIYAYIAFLLGYNTLRRLEHMVNFRKRHRHATANQRLRQAPDGTCDAQDPRADA